MRKYEVMYIVNPALDDEARAKLIENLHKILTDNGATVNDVNEWGLRELAYRINDLNKGYYVVTKFETDNNDAVSEFDRLSRINNDVLRHMIINLDEVKA